jgi:signal transduction histidine kinase/ligand-binding sensor domain-containing protein
MRPVPYIFRFVLLSLMPVYMFANCALAYSPAAPYVQFKVYGVYNGLADQYVEDVFIDSKGIVWAATQNGLSVYNGISFSNYSKDYNNPEGLESNYLHALHEDTQGRLWIGSTYGGLYYFDKTEKTIVRYYAKGQGPINGGVIGFSQACEGGIWLGSNNGILKFYPKEDSLLSYDTELCDGILSDNRSARKIVTIGEQLFSGFSNRPGLLVAQRGSNTFSCIADSLIPSNLRGFTVRELASGRDGTLWIATGSHGLLRYFPATGKWEHYSAKSGHLPLDYLWCVYIDDKGLVWYGTVNGGMGCLGEANSAPLVLKNDPHDLSSLPSNSVTSITQDKEGYYWVATHGGGLAQFKYFSHGFKHYRRTTGTELGLTHNVVSSFAESQDKKIWVGTDGGGIHIFCPGKGFIGHIGKADGLGSDAVISLGSQAGDIISAGWEHGLCRINTASQKIACLKASSKTSNKPNSDNIKHLTKDSTGRLWLASHSLGGAQVQLKSGAITNDSALLGTGFSLKQFSWLNHIMQDSKGRTWLSTNAGAFMHCKESGTKKFLREMGDTSGLTSDVVVKIFEDSRGLVWLCSNDGLHLYDESKNKFTNYSHKHGLPSNIKSIEEDSKGDLWISSLSNLVRLRPEGMEFRLFGMKDGLQKNIYYDRSSFKSSAGELYFGGLNGFVVFRPDEIQESVSALEVDLADFSVFNKSRWNILRHNNKSDFNYTVEVPYEYSVLTFDYSALSYWEPQSINYSYFLEGFDKEWQHVGNQTRLSYTNLNPGRYVLRISASAAGGYTDGKLAIEIWVKPPFWLTWWFKSSLVLLVTFMLVAFYLWRVHTFKLQKTILEHEVRKRTFELNRLNSNLEEQSEEILQQNEILEQQKKKLEEYNEQILRKTGEVLLQKEHILDQNELLEKKNTELDELIKTKDKFFSIIAHDLKNPINAIMGFSELMLKRGDSQTPEKRKEFARHINLSASMVYNLLVNLLDWARSQSHSLKARPKIYDMQQVMADNFTLMADLAEAKNLTIKLGVEPGLRAYADINILNTVMRNLISNAIKFTPRGGEVTVTSWGIEEDNIYISVSDTGIGMDPAKLKTIFDMENNTSTSGTEHEKGSGLGLLVVKEFVAANGGKIKAHSSIGVGTVFTFTLPKARQQ